VEAPAGPDRAAALLRAAALHAAAGRRACLSVPSATAQRRLIETAWPAVAAACTHAAGRAPRLAVRRGMAGFGSPSRIRALRERAGGRLGAFLDRLAGEAEDAGALPDLAEAAMRTPFPPGLALQDVCLTTWCPPEELALYPDHGEPAQEAELILVGHAYLLRRARLYDGWATAEDGRRLREGDDALGRLDALVVDGADALPALAEAIGADRVAADVLRALADRAGVPALAGVADRLESADAGDPAGLRRICADALRGLRAARNALHPPGTPGRPSDLALTASAEAAAAADVLAALEAGRPVAVAGPPTPAVHVPGAGARAASRPWRGPAAPPLAVVLAATPGAADLGGGTVGAGAP
jgi:Rad3-related DNA helicase